LKDAHDSRGTQKGEEKVKVTFREIWNREKRKVKRVLGESVGDLKKNLGEKIWGGGELYMGVI